MKKSSLGEYNSCTLQTNLYDSIITAAEILYGHDRLTLQLLHLQVTQTILINMS